MQHIEFFHNDHFDFHYKREKPPRLLAYYIEYFWETEFENLWERYPEGFSDALFPNTGYTYMINLGTPFVMQLPSGSFEVKSAIFLPRAEDMICHHSTGNKIFGIKFKVSPVLHQRKINFSEYRNGVYPLTYLIDQEMIESLKKAGSFQERVDLASRYYSGILKKYSSHDKHVRIVTSILKDCHERNDFSVSIEALAARHSVTSRTLLRYFESATGLSCKKALQIMRIRKAVSDMTSRKTDFRYTDYGYYDHSHFYKHLKAYLKNGMLKTEVTGFMRS